MCELEMKNKLGRKWSIGYTKKNLAMLYLEKKEYKKAKKQIEEGLEISSGIKALCLKKDFYYCIIITIIY